MKFCFFVFASLLWASCSSDRGGESADGCVQPGVFERAEETNDQTVFGTAIDTSGAMAGLYRGGNQAKLIAFSETGEVSEEIPIQGYPAESGFSKAASTGFVVAGASLTEVDSDGAIRWAFSTQLSLRAAVPSATGGAWGIYRNQAGVEIGDEVLADGAGLVLVRVSDSGTYLSHSKVMAASVRGPLRGAPLSDGGFVLAGEFQGQLNFEGESVEAAERSDFVARITSDGQAAWITTFENTSTSTQPHAKHAITTFSDDSTSYVHRASSDVVLYHLDENGEVMQSESFGSRDLGSRGGTIATTSNDQLAFWHETRTDGIAVLELRAPGGGAIVSTRVCLPDEAGWFLPGGVAVTNDSIVLGGELLRPKNKPNDPDRAQTDAIFFAGSRDAFKLQ